MKNSYTFLLPLAFLLPAASTGCGSENVSFTEGAGASGSSDAAGSAGQAGNAGNAGSAGSAPSGGNAGNAGNAGSAPSGGTAGNAGNAGAGGTGGSAMDVADPSKDGPYQTATIDDNATSGDHQVPIHCVYPTGGPGAGPYPVVIIGHGFMLPASQYYKYVERLGTFGYVALTADFKTSAFTPDNPGNAADMIAALDWVKAKLPDEANTDLAGVTGHSLGGKIALLAASKDARFKASITLDPVDGGGGPGGACQAPGCVDVSALMPMLDIPTGFLGETTDAMGGFQPCAPAAESYTTFHAKANSPSLSVTVKGANHMSFLDDVASCGFTCSFCNMATLDNATVNGMARAYVVAFYERHLRKNTQYDTYLTGAKAQELYVAPGIATIESK